VAREGTPPPSGRRERRTRRLALFALVCTAFAYGYVAQGTGANQASHYALVKALADGTPHIDRTQHEIGDLDTSDVLRYHGHVYSSRSPGLAFVVLPAYLVIENVGIRTLGDPTAVLWALTLVGVVAPALALLVLVARVAERLEPGLGAPAALFLGLATLLLPYATLFFAHVLSALLGFAAFALLVGIRSRPGALLRVGAAGLVAGLAVVAEYPLALTALIIGAYAVSGRDRPARAVAYLTGFVVGLVPLLVYNTWAFGAPWHVSYRYLGPGTGLVDVPHPLVALNLLLGSLGLLRTTPVVVCGLIGLVLLYRRGHRAEAVASGAIFAGHLLYNASYFVPYGGVSAGPRFLIVALPFVALGLAAALRAFPTPSVVLGVVSAAIMTIFTATHPLSAGDGHVVERLTHNGFSQTVVELRVVLGWVTIVPFFVAVACAVAAAVALSRLSVGRRDAVVAVAAVAAWLVVAVFGTRWTLEQTPRDGVFALLLAAVAVTAVFAAARVVGAAPAVPTTEGRGAV